ncbi:MAG: hypothetical protein HKN26_01585 [Acidimicrobiales bacterium]|nr:hypothetical protein [Acidimicrobiales bacterium]
MARITAGVLVTILGIVMLPLPGPGMLIVASGLVVLSADVPWAERALIEVRRRTPGIPEDGKIPRGTIVKMVLITAAGILASVWWTFLR